MVLDYFKLREQPFGVTPDARYLFLSSTHREALGSLLYGVDEGFGGLRERCVFGVLGDGSIGIGGEHRKHFGAVYGAELSVTGTDGELAFAASAAAAKFFDEFNAERFHWVPALNPSG